MANVLVKSDYLSDIADAIREKLSTEDTYKPGEMAEAIESIQTGGGGGGIIPTGTITIDENGTYDVTNYASAEVDVPSGGSGADTITSLLTKELMSYSYSGTSINPYQFSGGSSITEISVPNILEIPDYAFNGCSALETLATMASATKIGEGSFKGCESLESLSFDNVTTVGKNAFENCTGLELIRLPEATTVNAYTFAAVGSSEHLATIILPKLSGQVPANAIRSGCKLKAVDFGANVAGFASYNFMNDTTIETIILRQTAGVVTCASASSITGVSATTKVYVPSSLISSYESASYWSAKGQIFYALEGSEFETKYADGTTIPT